MWTAVHDFISDGDERRRPRNAPSTPATMSKQQATLSKQRSTLLPQMVTVSNDSIVKFRPFDKVETNWTCSIYAQFVSTLSKGQNFVRHCYPNRQHCCQKRQQCRSNIRNCRKNHSTCSILQRCLDCCLCGRGFYKVACCFDIVAGMDGALAVSVADVYIVRLQNRRVVENVREINVLIL